MTELPDGVFRFLLSVLTGGFAGAWLIHDLVLLARLRRADRREPRTRDQRFGYLVGIVIGAIGLVGTLRFNGIL